MEEYTYTLATDNTDFGALRMVQKYVMVVFKREFLYVSKKFWIFYFKTLKIGTEVTPRWIYFVIFHFFAQVPL